MAVLFSWFYSFGHYLLIAVCGRWEFGLLASFCPYHVIFIPPNSQYKFYPDFVKSLLTIYIIVIQVLFAPEPCGERWSLFFSCPPFCFYVCVFKNLCWVNNYIVSFVYLHQLSSSPFKTFRHPVLHQFCLLQASDPNWSFPHPVQSSPSPSPSATLGFLLPVFHAFLFLGLFSHCHSVNPTVASWESLHRWKMFFNLHIKNFLYVSLILDR